MKGVNSYKVRQSMKKKIVFYIGSLAKGGAERVIVNLAAAMLKSGHEVLLVTSVKLEEEYPLPEGARRIVTYQNPEEVGKNRVRNFLKRCITQRRIWKKERPDVIVAFIGKNNAMAAITAWGLKIPVLVSVRGEPHEEYHNKPLKLCARYLFPRTAGVILQTEDSKDFFVPGVVKKAVVLPNPLNPVFVEGEAADILRRDQDKERNKEAGENVRQPKRITMVGRIDANKNQRLVIDAFSRLAELFPEYLLEIWGKGEDREELIAYVKELGLEKRILFPGTTEDVKSKLKGSSLYILSSNTEGMPNALMEAMAMGLPVISTDCPCGGPKMLIENGVNGLLVPVKDVRAMAEAMEKLMSDEKLARSMGEKALEIRQRLNPDRVNAQWESYILSKCLSSR